MYRRRRVVRRRRRPLLRRRRVMRRRLPRVRRRFIRRVRGRGSYRIRGQKVAVGQSVPHFGSGTGSVRVKHREFISDIAAPSTAQSFLGYTYPVQPGMASTFPWLSQIADNFQEYRLHGVVFEYISTSANALNSTNTALGSIVLSAEYNAGYQGWNNASTNGFPVNPFTSKQAAENAQFSVSGKPSANLMHGIEVKRRQSVSPELYVRSGAIQSGLDPRLYDFAAFQLSIVGCQGTSFNLGELWVTYDIELLKPQIGAALGNVDHFQISKNLATVGGIQSVAPFGSTVGASCPAASSQYGIGGYLLSGPNANNASSGCYNWPAWVRNGTYLCQYIVYGSATTLTSGVNWSLGTNLTDTALFADDSNPSVQVTPGATLSQTQWGQTLLAFNGQNAVGQSWVSINSGPTIPLANIQAEFWVYAINPPTK